MAQLERLHRAFSNVTKSVSGHGIELGSLTYPFQEDIQLKAQALSAQELDQISKSFESYSDIIGADPVPNELPAEVNKRHLRSFLHKFGLKVDERIFDFITDELLIEVYSRNHQQLFRSINFFSLSQYTLPELTFSPWDELFRRSKSDHGAMMRGIDTSLQNGLGPMTPNISVHLLEELKSGRKFRYEMVKLACVFDEFLKAPVGYLTLISVRELRGDVTLLQ